MPWAAYDDELLVSTDGDMHFVGLVKGEVGGVSRQELDVSGNSKLLRNASLLKSVSFGGVIGRLRSLSAELELA